MVGFPPTNNSAERCSASIAETRNRLGLALGAILLLFVLCPAKAYSIKEAHSQQQPVGGDDTVISHDEELPRAAGLEREIKKGESHFYRIFLEAGQYLHVDVDQNGVDAVLSLYGSNKKKISELDRWSDTHGLEMISLVVERSSIYWLEVRALETDVSGGSYQWKNIEVRIATRQDAIRTNAEKTYSKGDELAGHDNIQSQLLAIESLEQSLKLWQGVEDQLWQATTLLYIGTIYYNLGDIHKALEDYDKALPLWRSLGDREGELATLSSIGLVHESSGEYQLALSYYDLALPLARTSKNREWGEANLLHNLAIAYTSFGDFQKALDYFNQALQIHRNEGDKAAEAHMLHHIGEVYLLDGDNKRAFDFLNKALSYSRAEDDSLGVATALNHLGRLQYLSGDLHQALNFYTEALQRRRSAGYRLGEAQTLNNIGTVYQSLREYQKALEYYSEALRLRRTTGDRRGEAETLYGIAGTEYARGNRIEALAQVKRALEIIESLRGKVTNRELRTSYFATVQDYYELYIDVLMDLHKASPSSGYDSAALDVSERKRARNLLDTLTEARVDIRQGVSPTLIKREAFLAKEINARAIFQMKLLARSHTEQEASATSKAIELLTAEFEQVEAQIRNSSPTMAALTQPDPVTLQQIQTNLLDRDTVLLEFSLGSKQSYVWAVTPTSLNSYELPKRNEIDVEARHLYQLLVSRSQLARTGTNSEQRQRVAEADAQVPAVAANLSQMLLGPLKEQLGNKRLLIVTEGALQFIPFGILPDVSGNKASVSEPLVLGHEIVSLPSASTLSVLRAAVTDRKPPTQMLAVLADPVFESDDKRITARTLEDNQDRGALRKKSATDCRSAALKKSVQDVGSIDDSPCIRRLIGTRREGEGILSLVPANLRKRAFDFDANRQTVNDGNLENYRYVHFATHGIIDSVHPELSAIVLSLFDAHGTPQDGFLRAHEIFNLKLKADVVVLSACETGLGKDVKGEGLISLTRGFMYAGAPRVVVSLWSVDDAATAKLMMRFYRGMVRENLRPAKALQAAQISMLKEQQYRVPFYWAAFTLQGEWL